MNSPLLSLLTESLPSDIDRARESTVSIIKEITSENQKKLNEGNINSLFDLTRCDPSAISMKVGIARYLLEKWAAIAKLALNEIQGTDETSKKILFCGLDNAGKSTLLKALSDCAGNPDYLDSLTKTYRPTLGSGIVQTKLFNILNVIIWDLGGHKQFRDFWLMKDTSHIAKTDLMIFMIDAQDTERFKEAKEYLYEFLERLDEINLNPSLFVVFSKVDPDLALQLEGPICELRANMEEKLHTYRSKWGRSTIYNSVSIFRHFSKAARPIIPGLVLLDNEIKELGDKYPVRGIVVQDDAGFVLAHYELEDGSTNEMIDYIMKKGFKSRHPDIQFEINRPIDPKNVYKILEHEFYLKSNARFFVTVKVTVETNDDILEQILPHIKKWLDYF